MLGAWGRRGQKPSKPWPASHQGPHKEGVGVKPAGSRPGCSTSVLSALSLGSSSAWQGFPSCWVSWGSLWDRRCPSQAGSRRGAVMSRAGSVLPPPLGASGLDLAELLRPERSQGRRGIWVEGPGQG